MMDTLAPLRWFARRPVPAQAAARAAAHSAAALPFDPSDFVPALQTRLLVLQPTPFCNIRCDYCYLPDRDTKTRMSLATVRQAALRLRQDGLAGPALTVVWHAGEPLAMPQAFYESAVAVLDDVLGGQCMLSHSLQTNATLIDEAWCRLFQRLGMRVGVSIDGPAALHDRHRRTRTGKGTHAAVLRGMALLRAHGIAHHAIAVVTRDTLDDADGFADFFLQHGVQDVGCNFDEAEGGHRVSSLAGVEAAHGRFLARLLERSHASQGRLRVRELAHARRVVTQGLPSYRWQQVQWPLNDQVLPFAMVNVAAHGDFGTWSPELLGQADAAHGHFVLGNVHQGSYLQAARTPQFDLQWQQIMRGVQACRRQCAHFEYCGGGAPANKHFENGALDSTETLYCRAMVKRPFDIVLDDCERTVLHQEH
jgi:uncharacterized protein